MSRSFSSFPDDLFEDLPEPTFSPKICDLEESVSSKPPVVKKRYYIEPSLTDEELCRLSSSDISEWPKSKVIWALGRLGYIERKCGHLNLSTKNSSRLLVFRLEQFINLMNTRDIVRAIQGIAYSRDIDTSFIPIVNQLRRKFSLSIDSVNELFLASFIYANLKLINRNDWVISNTCKSTLQFLLSEMVHRKHKMLCSNWLELCSTILKSREVVKSSLTSSIDAIVQHSFSFAMNHVKDANIMASFAKSLIGYNSTIDYEAINNMLGRKFSKPWISANDAIQFAFFFFINDLMSPGNVEKWITSVRTASKEEIRKEDLNNRVILGLIKWKLSGNEKNLLSDENRIWIDAIDNVSHFGLIPPNLSEVYSPIITSDSIHVNKVLIRMANSTIENYTSRFIGPFWCPVVLDSSQVVIEWDTPSDLEPPYRRAWSKHLTIMRRKFLLAENGWKILKLNRSDFIAHSSDEKIMVNEKFVSLVRDMVGEHQSIGWKAGGVEIIEGSEHLVPSRVKEEEMKGGERVRRESKRLENILRAKRRTITKQVRKKILRRKKSK